MTIEELLEKLYYSFEYPSAYSGAVSLFREAKKKNSNIRLVDVKKWLKKELTYTLHHPVKRKFKTRPVTVPGKEYQWQSDLADVSKLSRQNNGYKFLLVIIDVFSKYAWVKPVRSKNAKDIKNAFHQIFVESKQQPKLLQTDKGGEFLNRQVKEMLEKRNIKLFTTSSERKASIVERFNRTLKNLMYRYFTKSNSRRYVDILDDLVNKYNNTVHSAIKMKPSEVTEQNEPEVWINLYEGKIFQKNQWKRRKSKYNTGDLVRISIERGPFRKGYLEGWSEELFVVKSTVPGNTTVYKLEDQNGEDLKGVFYSEELQKVSEPSSYRVEKVIRKKIDKRRGKTLLLVKWRGYPSSFNSYIEEEDLIPH